MLPGAVPTPPPLICFDVFFAACLCQIPTPELSEHQLGEHDLFAVWGSDGIFEFLRFIFADLARLQCHPCLIHATPCARQQRKCSPYRVPAQARPRQGGGRAWTGQCCTKLTIFRTTLRSCYARLCVFLRAVACMCAAVLLCCLQAARKRWMKETKETYVDDCTCVIAMFRQYD